MSVTEKIVEKIIGRMSQEDKTALFEHAMQKFFDDMTPEEKQQLIEKVVQKLVEGVDMKDIFPRVMSTLWNKSGVGEEGASLLNKMSQMASDTGGKLSDMLPSRFKNTR